MSADLAWLVTVDGYDPVTFEAPTANKARYRAFLAFRDAVTRLSFRDFLARGIRVVRADGTR